MESLRPRRGDLRGLSTEPSADAVGMGGYLGADPAGAPARPRTRGSAVLKAEVNVTEEGHMENTNPDIAQNGHYHLVLFQMPSDRERGHIHADVVYEVQAKLNEKITTSPDQTTIDMWIKSTGGDIHAAFKLLLDIRSRCSTLRSVVLDYAKSAATLLVLGTDEIFMGDSAELGPLDAQVQHPDRETEWISALDVANALPFLKDTAVNMIVGMIKVAQAFALSRVQAIDALSVFAARFLEPLIGKLDPSLIHRAGKQLNVAEEYGKIALERRAAKLPPGADVGSIVKQLVRGYPDHSFVIDARQAKDLKLPIKDALRHSRIQPMSDLHELHRAGDKSTIAVFTDAELAEAARCREKESIDHEAQGLSSQEDGGDSPKTDNGSGGEADDQDPHRGKTE